MTPAFLELAVGTGDILDSLAFYRQLGFSELATSDAVDHAYAAVTDGAVAIGLHGVDEFVPALRYVRANVRRFVLDAGDAGTDFDDVKLDDDHLHQASLDDPWGHRVTWVEARTFSPPPAETQPSQLGELLEITLPVDDLYRAARFWAPYSERVAAERDEPAHLRLDTNGVAVGLSEERLVPGPALSYCVRDATTLQETLNRFDLPLAAGPLPGHAFARLNAPEGTAFILWREDFVTA
ncbi:MAG: hypothetical protein AAFX58_02275 [Pseudomonadota bacterium]